VARSLFAVLLVFAFAAGCGQLKEAPEDEGGGANVPDDGGGTSEPAPDASTIGGDGGGDAGIETWDTYDEAQSALEAKRFPGPLTAAGSRGECTANHLVWRDSDGALHSWAAQTQSRIDYTFVAPQNRPLFAPSDSYVVVDVAPTYAELALYKTGEPGTKVTGIPYAYAWAAADGAVIRADQSIDNAPLGGTKVRRWNAGSGITEDISQILPTQQPPAAFAKGELVIPGDVVIPHPLYIVDVAKKTTASVVFDGALTARQILPSAEGLLVSYVRSGGTSALRIYRNNQDSAASRYELGDDLANRPGLYPDSPANEHRLNYRIAMHGRTLLYGSLYGIFAYDFVSGALAPVQLAVKDTAMVADILCVIRDRGLLVYRDISDSQGQIWVVPLAGLIP
jgi:hypothetical protein